MAIEPRFLLLQHRHEKNLIDVFNQDDYFSKLFAESLKRAIPDVHKQFILYQLARTKSAAGGSFAELGVFRGGTAYLLAKLVGDKRLYLFDTFAGMPKTDAKLDLHKEGDFSNTSLEEVRSFVGAKENILYRQGFFPTTARGITDFFAFVHIDADIYQSVRDGCEWFYNRMTPGGIMLFDDYCARSCPGAKKAVDEFFATQPEKPIYLPTGQCFVVVNPENRPLDRQTLEDFLW